MAYIELEDLKGYLDISITEDNPLIQEAIKAAQKFIEDQTHRVFEATTATKYYDRAALDDHNSTILHLDDDCLTVTELLNGDADATEITSDYYWLLHRNLGPPYRAIQLTTNDGYYWQWGVDCWVEVTGTWGYTATPDSSIKEATKVLASFYYRAKDSQIFKTTAIPEAGVITIPQGVPTRIKNILESHTKNI